MFNRSGKIGVLIALAVLLFTSCAAPQTSLPTPDLNLVRTEAVVTAVALMTKQAALNPIPTQKPVIPTAEPFVTSTPIVVTATTSIFGSGGVSSGGTSGGSGSGGAIVPTWTPDVYIVAVVGVNYLDGHVFPTGEEPDYQVTLQNLGVATWDTAHYYIKRMYNNPEVPLTSSDTYPLPVDTPYGSKVTFTIDIICPKYPGRWITQWGLVNDNGEIIGKFYFLFYTGLHATPTPIKTNTPSPG